VVLAPKRKTYADLADDWEVVRGTKDHDAIIEYEPGSECAGDEDLAKAVSRKAKHPAYVLWCNEEYPRVQAFANGTYAGDVKAWPDHVARQLGCTFPTMDGGRGTVDLTPHKAPDAKAGEQTIGRWTVRQWQHMIEHDSDWSILLDGAGEDAAKEVLAILDDKKAAVREVACNLLRAIGYIGDCEFGLGTLAPSTLERLRGLAARDPDAKVRAAAKKTADDLSESLEMYAIRAEFPWINNYTEKGLEPALAALDDEREAVRSYVVSWWMCAWEVPKPIGRKVEKKLVALLANAKRDARDGIELALDNVRRKMNGED
jgi:hypothetical protein